MEQAPASVQRTDGNTCIHIRVEGVVQSVGFRAYTVDVARQLNVDGWVRNCYDGTVEAVVFGPTVAVEAFVAQCLRGPAFAHVENIDIRPGVPPSRKGFRRLPTH